MAKLNEMKHLAASFLRGDVSWEQLIRGGTDETTSVNVVCQNPVCPCGCCNGRSSREVDSIVSSLIEQHIDRAKKGFAKYGHDLDRQDLTLLEWLEHAKTEAMDFALYIERVKREIANAN